jgi:hypothetical protein
VSRAKDAARKATEALKALEQRLKVLQLELKQLTSENSSMDQQVRRPAGRGSPPIWGACVWEWVPILSRPSSPWPTLVGTCCVSLLRSRVRWCWFAHAL